MAQLKFISEETLQDLRTNYEAYKEYYYEKDDNWFQHYLNEPGRVLESKIEFNIPTLNTDTDYSISDRENVKIIYDALKHLTVSQATQERLWAGLAHLQLRDYAFYRLKQDIEKKNDRRINSGVFFKGNGKKTGTFCPRYIASLVGRLYDI